MLSPIPVNLAGSCMQVQSGRGNDSWILRLVWMQRVLMAEAVQSDKLTSVPYNPTTRWMLRLVDDNWGVRDIALTPNYYIWGGQLTPLTPQLRRHWSQLLLSSCSITYIDVGIEATTCTHSAELPIRYDKQLLIFRFVFKPVFPMHVFPSSIWLYCIFLFVWWGA